MKMRPYILIAMYLMLFIALSASRVWDASASRKYAYVPIAPKYSEAKADSAHGFDVQKYVITLSISQNPNSINGKVLATVLATENLPSISYELVGLMVSQVKVNGNVATFNHSGGILTIPVNAAANETFTTEVFYGGTPQLSGNAYNIGMYFQANSIFTISDPDAGRFWWPCYDHPWDKAIVDLIITMRSDWKVAANGLRQGIVNNGNGTSTTTWLGSHPMTTYLVCITAGPYQEIAQTAMNGSLPILNFVTQNQYNNAMIDLASLPDMIDYYSELFGDYPFEKYGNATVSMSTFGAMEHQTMTTLGNFIITGNHTHELTIAHELVHQWYGDAVSFLNFNDVWLSEGFATYGEHLWVDKVSGWQAATDYVNTSYHQYYNGWENQNGAATIYNPSFLNYFTPPVYEKAASVLHMLRLKMGDAAFFQLLRQWFSTYKHGNVITAEFQAMAESIYGQSLQQFFQQWIFGSGVPSLEYSVYHKNANTPQLKIIAKTTSPTSTPFFLDVPFRITNANGADSLFVRANPSGQINVFDNIANPNEVIANYRNWTLLKQSTVRNPLLSECIPSGGAVMLAWQAFAGANSYHVYRRIGTAGAWQQVNVTPVLGLSYTDETVINGTSYQYTVKAIDLEGFISMASNILSATPVELNFANYLLVVDETRDGTGANINPDDAMVDSFYNSVLTPLEYDEWDVAASGLPSLGTLGNYRIVLWHADDFSQNMMQDAEQQLSGYLMGGGQVLISGWKVSSVLSPAFLNRFAPSVNVYYDNGSCLISATSDNYPDLLVDSTKLAAAWNGMLPMIHSFAGAQSLYTANMPAGFNGYNRSVAYREGNLNFFGFPLYFMQQDGVRQMLQQMLPELFTVANSDELAPALKLNLFCYPNPFNPHSTVSFTLPKAGNVRMALYNMKGQFINNLAVGEYAAGTHSIALNAEKLSSGIYYIRMQTPTGNVSRRITLLK